LNRDLATTKIMQLKWYFSRGSKW